MNLTFLYSQSKKGITPITDWLPIPLWRSWKKEIILGKNQIYIFSNWAQARSIHIKSILFHFWQKKITSLAWGIHINTSFRFQESDLFWTERVYDPKEYISSKTFNSNLCLRPWQGFSRLGRKWSFHKWKDSVTWTQNSFNE